MRRKYFTEQAYSEIPCGLVAFKNNVEQELVFANECYYKFFSGGTEGALNVLEEDRPLIKEAADKLDKAECAEVKYRCSLDNGGVLYASMSMRDMGGGVILGALHDISDQHNIIDRLTNENERYAVIMSSSGNIVFEMDIVKDTFTLYVPYETTMKRVSEKNQIQCVKRFVHPEEQALILERLYKENEVTLSARLKLPGDEEWVWYRMRRYFDHNEQGELIRIHGLITNITDEKQHEEELKESFDIDPVLKIYNRNAAVRIIDKYILDNSDSRNYALLVMDIDNFKNINDTHGHLYGDAVIEQTANTIREIVGDNGIVGRYGGDEFFVFLRGCDDAVIARICDRIIEGTGAIHNGSGNMSVSMGVALGTAFEELPKYKAMFERADKALYYVKKNGKAHWRVYEAEFMSEESGRALDYAKEDDSECFEMLKSMDMMKVFLELSSLAKTSDAAVYNIMRYITEKFAFDWMQVMQVNMQEDKVTIKYEFCNDSSFHNNSGKSGYYVHSDIMLFRDKFEKKPIFLVRPENIVGFSPKFQREFEKNMNHSVVYIANLTMDDSFYMFVCTRFDKNHKWFEDECEELNEATKMMTMYVAQSDRETENERKLKKMVEYDRKTELYSIMEFYIQLGRLRKQAEEMGEEVALLHIDIGNFLSFNRSFGFEEGDTLLLNYARKIRYSFDHESCIGTHIDGTDIYFFAIRKRCGDRDFIERFHNINVKFCAAINEKYNGSNIFLRMGIHNLKPSEEGGVGFDNALLAKRAVRDKYNESYYAVYGE